MAIAWKVMSFEVARLTHETGRGKLSADQRCRLVDAIQPIWVAGKGATSTEEDWRRALCYTPSEWLAARDAFAEVLQHDGAWFLPFMRDEAGRQAKESLKQAAKGRARWGKDGSPDSSGTATVEPRLSHGTATGEPVFSPATGSGTGSAAGSEPESKSTDAGPASAVPIEPETGPEQAEENRQRVLTLLGTVAGHMRLPEAPRPAPRPAAPSVTPKKAPGPPDPILEPLGRVCELAKPFGGPFVARAMKLCRWLVNHGLTHPGLVERFGRHFVANHARVANEFAYYNPGGEGFEAIRTRLAAEMAVDEHAELERATREWLSGKKRATA